MAQQVRFPEGLSFISRRNFAPGNKPENWTRIMHLLSTISPVVPYFHLHAFFKKTRWVLWLSSLSESQNPAPTYWELYALLEGDYNERRRKRNQRAEELTV